MSSGWSDTRTKEIWWSEPREQVRAQRTEWIIYEDGGDGDRGSRDDNTNQSVCRRLEYCTPWRVCCTVEKNINLRWWVVVVVAVILSCNNPTQHFVIVSIVGNGIFSQDTTRCVVLGPLKSWSGQARAYIVIIIHSSSTESESVEQQPCRLPRPGEKDPCPIEGDSDEP